MCVAENGQIMVFVMELCMGEIDMIHVFILLITAKNEIDREGCEYFLS